LKTRRCDTDDIVVLTVECDRFADERWIGSEATLPQRVAHDDNRLVSRLFVLRNKQSSVLRGDSEDIEEVCIRLREVDPLSVIGECEVCRGGLNRGEVFEDCVLRAPVEEVGGR